MNDIALIICLDKNKKIFNKNGDVKCFYYYEYEAIKCVKSWRKNAGWLKHIPIYAFIFDDNKPTQKTLNVLEQYDVKFIELKNINFDYLFLNTLYIQYYCIHNLKESIFIYSDLDLYINNPIPEEFIQQSNDKLVIAYYDRNTINMDYHDYRYYNILKLHGYNHNTYFMITNKNNNYIDIIYNLIGSKEYEEFFKKYIHFQKTNDSYYYEEGLYDFAYLKTLINFYHLGISYLEEHYFTHKHLTPRDIINV